MIEYLSTDTSNCQQKIKRIKVRLLWFDVGIGFILVDRCIKLLLLHKKAMMSFKGEDDE